MLATIQLNVRNVGRRAAITVDDMNQLMQNSVRTRYVNAKAIEVSATAATLPFKEERNGRGRWRALAALTTRRSHEMFGRRDRMVPVMHNNFDGSSMTRYAGQSSTLVS
jgi:hypothetical protein